jgi:phage shock protein A
MTALVTSALTAINAALTAAQESEARANALREANTRLQATVEQLEADLADLRARCQAIGTAPTKPALVVAFDSKRKESA